MQQPFENMVLDDILDWADENLDSNTTIQLPELIELYWSKKFAEIE